MSPRRKSGGRKRRPLRWRSLRRWLALGAAVLLLAVSMASAVRRGAEARRLSRDVEALRAAERVTRERLTEVSRRADSLASRARIADAARALGLRPATEEEIVFLEAPTDGAGTEVAPPAVVARTGEARADGAERSGGGG